VPTNAVSTASITPASLYVAGVVALDKEYDGTTVAHLNTQAATVSGRFGADDVQISTITGTFLDRNVGTDKQIGAGTVVLSGADAGDYVLVQPTHLTADITARELLVSATGIDKVYDGTTTASVTLLDNRVSGDSLSLTSTNAFIDENAGSGKYINVSAIALGGTDAGNYFVNQTSGAFATIDRASLPVSIVGVDRPYDGTTNASVSFTHSALAGDDVQVLFGSASFADRNVGTDKDITVSGLALGGADAGNYSIDIVATAIADITPSSVIIDVPSQVAGTWTLLPAMPTPIPASQPVTPPSVLDMTLPALPVRNVTNGGSTNSGAGVQAYSSTGVGTPAASLGSETRQITVSIVHSPIGQYPGRIAVRVPGAMLQSGNGFSFPLPKSLAEEADTDELLISLAGDQPLPSWLRYVADTKTFVATTPPLAALPLDVLLQIGKKSWMMTLIQRVD
jgi:hypothetical protein